VEKPAGRRGKEKGRAHYCKNKLGWKVHLERAFFTIKRIQQEINHTKIEITKTQRRGVGCGVKRFEEKWECKRIRCLKKNSPQEVLGTGAT